MLRRAIVAALVIACVALPSIATAGTTTVTFDDLTSPNRALTGQYPTGVIDWGSAGTWWLSGPWGQFTTNSISFNGASATSASFSFINPQRLLQLDAFNGGGGASTVSLSCTGQPTVSRSVAANTRLTIATGWSGTCTTVTVGSSNGWNTNFDNLVFDNGAGPVLSAIATSNLTHTSATVTWTTNVAATSQVEYGLTASYGTLSPLNTTLVTAHSVSISGLQGGTVYHYRVRSSDAAGNLSMSGDNVFSTTSPFCDPPITNPVACENSQPGTPPSQWDIPTQDAGDASIQGFATDISYPLGATATFKINTPASAYSIVIYRIGYYQGNGARQIATVTPSAHLPQTQPACLRNTTSGLIDCGNWAASATWTIPSGAVPGVYIAKLTRSDTGGTSHIIFVVRDDASTAPIVVQTSDTTWQAYNSYGGNSLYAGGPLGNPGRAAKVSYNRPFNTRTLINGLGPYSFFWDSEYPMVRWLEANGYNVTYASAVDTDRRGAAALEQHHVYLSVGHDEYWSAGERASVEAARAAGVNLAFFSGNQTFWKTRYENSIDGSNTPYRTLVTYKETHANAVIDPADPPIWTGTWRDPRFSPPADGGRPENALAGPLFMVNGYRTDTITVGSAFSGLRFWRNTAIAHLAGGGSVNLEPNSLGYEWDVDADNGFRPAGLIDLSSTTLNVNGSLLQDYGSTYGNGTATHSLTLYRAPSGALVFGAGYTRWAWGLDATHDTSGGPADPNMQQATVNLLADMGVQPATLQSGLVAASASTDTTPPHSSITSPSAGATLPPGVPVTISGSASDSGGGVVGGVEVSVDGGTTWHPASGTTAWSFSWTPAANGQVTLRSRAADDSANIETPSAGITVTVGTAATATPTSTPTSTPTPTPGGPTATPTSTPTATPTPLPGSQTITFDDLANPNRVLSGQYPTSLIDWGTTAWYLSGPYGSFTTNSISFNGASPTSASLTFLSPRRLVQLQAFNGGTGASTITLACPGQPTVTTTVGAGQLTTITTNWTATCTSVIVGSSNGWWTNFDTLLIDTGP